MLTIFDSYRDITTFSVILRMLFATLCGAAIGFERSYKNRPAGLRTHMLVCIGSAAAAMTGLYLYLNLLVPSDISRMGAQVISGLGFIGAGTIIVTRRRTIIGLTTAAGLWTAGIIGLAVGSGYYEGAIIATILVLLTETLLYKLSRRIPRITEVRIRLGYENRTDLDDVLRFFKDHKLTITNLHIEAGGNSGNAPQSSDAEPSAQKTPQYFATITLLMSRGSNREALLQQAESMPGVITLVGVDEI